MKKLNEFDRSAVHQLIADEGWDQPMAEITQVRLTTLQKSVFWGLRVYVVIMVTVVVWAFVHGAAG